MVLIEILYIMFSRLLIVRIIFERIYRLKKIFILQIEPEEKEFEIETDDIYEPKLEDLMEEEHDQREDRDSVDEEWEPDIKRAKMKREPSSTGDLWCCNSQ